MIISVRTSWLIAALLVLVFISGAMWYADPPRTHHTHWMSPVWETR